MNDMMETIKTFDGKKLPIRHIPGPEGVRGRNSDNALILEKLGWEPTIRLADGLKVTYFWIKGQLEEVSAALLASHPDASVRQPPAASHPVSRVQPADLHHLAGCTFASQLSLAALISVAACWLQPSLIATLPGHAGSHSNSEDSCCLLLDVPISSL